MAQASFLARGVALACAQGCAQKKRHSRHERECRFFLVRPAGIEPAAYSLGGYRSIQLSYERMGCL